MKQSEILVEMFALQQKLNDDTNGVGWEKGYNKHKKEINWKRCIYMECAELIDSFSWKHWKDINKEPDWENIKIEIVDIWHFIMSLALEYYHNDNTQNLEKIVDDLIKTKEFDDFCKESTPTLGTPSFIISLIERIIHETTGSNTDVYSSIIGTYLTLCVNCGINLKELYKYYIAKNVLNQFRQDNGYKEGSYIKNWGKKEDNEVMLELLEQEALSADELYRLLKKEYSKITASKF